MNQEHDFSFMKMKADIAKAGNYFYQYRPCKRDVATIYDIENIRHGVVYARTPLQMNDPYDSMVGFSVEHIYNECIDLVLNQTAVKLDSNLKLLIKYLLNNRLLGKTLEFIGALNSLKKYIFMQSLIAHVKPQNLQQFIVKNINKLYGKSPAEVKRYFNKDAFLVFALIIKNYQNIDIEEKTIIDSLNIEELLQKLEEAVLKAKDETYIPFLHDFLSKMTVTCFSASGWNNHLMWSHYANSYSGICVEYDFEKINRFIGFIYPVKYSNIRPTVSLKDLGLTEFKQDENGKLITKEVDINAIFSYLLAKNKCWSYEEEWRIINIDGKPNTPIFVDMPFIKSITLGLNLDDMCKQLLWDVCQERDIACYQLIVNSSDYCLDRKLLTTESFVFDDEKEERYINLLSEHTVPLGEKISSNCNALTESIKNGKFEAEALINVLTYTLDFLSDVYFLKTSFNRYCRNVNTSALEIANNAQLNTAITQIDEFLHQTEMGVEMIEKSLLAVRIMNKITSNDLAVSEQYIANIKEMIGKHKELKWYGIDKIVDTSTQE